MNVTFGDSALLIYYKCVGVKLQCMNNDKNIIFIENANNCFMIN